MLKKTTALFFAIIANIFFVIPVSAKTLQSDRLLETHFPMVTIIVLGLVVCLLGIGIYILVRTSQSKN